MRLSPKYPKVLDGFSFPQVPTGWTPCNPLLPPLHGPLGPQDTLLQHSEIARELFFKELRFHCPCCNTSKLIRDIKPYHKGVWPPIQCSACNKASASHKWACPCNSNWRDCPIHSKWLIFYKKPVRKVTSRLSVRFSSTEYLATPSRKRTAGPMGGDSTATLKPPCKHRKVSSCSNVSNGTTIHNTNERKAKTDVVPTNPNLLFRGMSTTALSKMPRLASRFGHLLAK
jgi:hypothetical protein